MASAQEMGSRRGKGTCQEKGAASFCPGQQPQRPAHHIYLRDAVEGVARVYHAGEDDWRISHVSLFYLAARKLSALISGLLCICLALVLLP